MISTNYYRQLIIGTGSLITPADQVVRWCKDRHYLEDTWFEYIIDTSRLNRTAICRKKIVPQIISWAIPSDSAWNAQAVKNLHENGFIYDIVSRHIGEQKHRRTTRAAGGYFIGMISRSDLNEPSSPWIGCEPTLNKVVIVNVEMRGKVKTSCWLNAGARTSAPREEPVHRWWRVGRQSNRRKGLESQL